MENNELASSLRMVSSRMTRRLRKQMNAVGSLSVSEVDTISYLYNMGPLSPTGLANLLMIKGQSVSEVLNHLEQLDMINKKPSEVDKRKFVVSLAAKGKKIVDQTRHERDKWLSNAIEHTLSAKEKSVLKEAITLLEKLVEFQ